MTRLEALRPKFVEFIPKQLEDGVLYISIPYATVVHRCACGCGGKTVARLSPKGWRLTYDGETVSLDPSIGNWSYPCQSHYWVSENRIVWAEKWSMEKIEKLRRAERGGDITRSKRDEPVHPPARRRYVRRVWSFVRDPFWRRRGTD